MRRVPAFLDVRADVMARPLFVRAWKRKEVQAAQSRTAVRNERHGACGIASAVPYIRSDESKSNIQELQVKFTVKNLCYGIAVSCLTLAAGQSSAATCTVVGSGGSVGFNLAVASNFYTAAQSIATGFLNSIGNTYKINVCHDSSGALDTEIRSTNTDYYALFLSADEDRPDNLVGTAFALGSAFDYANGIPVFFLSPNAYASGTYSASSYLNQGQGAGAVADGLTNYVTIKTSGSPSVSKLAIGNPTPAPYGEAAEVILTDMGISYGTYDSTNKVTAVSGSCSVSSGSNWVCEYNNISLTKQAIDNNEVTAGFISYGQVCAALGSSEPAAKYVKFPDSAYLVLQKGILLDITDGTAESRASAFKSYMLGGAGSADWNTWLQANCYAPI